ncbi:MAG: sulfite exporter TauE/SafE family protein [Planctomycetaceae bacterium]
MATILIGALVIGLTLGMLGSGGSAITVPVLIYMVGHGAKESIAESMGIVGLISVVAAIPYARSKQVEWTSVWYFGLPGMLGTLVGAWLGGIATDALQLVVFGGVLLVAAGSMLRNGSGVGSSLEDESGGSHQSSIWKIATEGSVVGIVTGFVGVGGGFLIVPALVILGKLPMRMAIGTSLIIISMKAAVGFAKYEHYLLSHDLSVDGKTILTFASVGIVGSLIGRSINQRLNQRVLKKVFGGFLIVLGGFVIFSEGSKLVNRPSESSGAGSNQTSLNFNAVNMAARLKSKEHSDVTQVLL